MLLDGDLPPGQNLASYARDPIIAPQTRPGLPPREVNEPEGKWLTSPRVVVSHMPPTTGAPHHLRLDGGDPRDGGGDWGRGRFMTLVRDPVATLASMRRFEQLMFGRMVTSKEKVGRGGGGKPLPPNPHSWPTCQVANDMNMAMFSILFVWFWIVVHTGSFFIGSLGMLQIFLSLPVSLFLYRVVLRIDYFETLQALAVFVILGVGADDIFVMVDAWVQVRCQSQKSTSRVTRSRR